MKIIMPLFTMILLSFALPIVAKEDIDPSKPGYLVLKPIVTNFAPYKPNHLSYVKVDVAISIGSQSDLESAQHYVPEIRDAIIFLLNQQSKVDLDGMTERQILANKGLELVQGIYLEETGEKLATDFMWGFFAIQN